MRIRVVASYAGKGVAPESLAAQDVDLAPGAAHTLAWNIQAPEANLLDGPSELEWRIEASDMSQTSRANTDGKASDRRAGDTLVFRQALLPRSEEHTSELQSIMRSSYAVFCLKKKNNRKR